MAKQIRNLIDKHGVEKLHAMIDQEYAEMQEFSEKIYDFAKAIKFPTEFGQSILSDLNNLKAFLTVVGFGRSKSVINASFSCASTCLAILFTEFINAIGIFLFSKYAISLLAFLNSLDKSIDIFIF